MPIYAKINEVMKRVRGVEKSDRNKFANYNYAGHEAVTDALRDHFASIGIVRQASVISCTLLDGGVVQLMVRVSYVDIEDGTMIDLDMPAIQPVQTKEKTVTAQQVGQAVSYAVKNVEFKLFSLTGDAEPDSDAGYHDHDDRPIQRRSYDERTAQAKAHDQANDLGEVVVKYDEYEQEGHATAAEGAKALAPRLKQASHAEAERMVKLNIEWIQKLPKDWQNRFDEIVAAKNVVGAAFDAQAPLNGRH